MECRIDSHETLADQEDTGPLVPQPLQTTVPNGLKRNYFRIQRSLNMSEQYRVRVADDSTTFASAHFITYDRDTCEPLHGHNFATAVTVEGPLDENHYVVDFVVLKKMVAELLAELDHRVLLPTEHDRIQVELHGEEVEVLFPGRRWVFPRSECVLLPVANTTVELLARHLARALVQRLSSPIGSDGLVVTVEVEESPGWSATCRLSAGSPFPANG